MTAAQRKLLTKISEATKTGDGHYPVGMEWRPFEALKRLGYVQRAPRAGYWSPVRPEGLHTQDAKLVSKHGRPTLHYYGRFG